MNKKQLEQIGGFLKYIFINNVSVVFTDFDKTKQIDSVSEFVKVLKEKAGENLSCVVDQRNNKVLIYDEGCKEYIGFLYGMVDYGYLRGDVHESVLHIQYAVIKNNVYIGGERVAYVFSPDQITVERDGLYVIDIDTNSLMKYCDYKLKWKTVVPVNSVQCYKFCPWKNYLGEPYPMGLIAIQDLSELYHFYCESGEFYGHTREKCQYEMIYDFM